MSINVVPLLLTLTQAIGIVVFFILCCMACTVLVFVCSQIITFVVFCFAGLKTIRITAKRDEIVVDGSDEEVEEDRNVEADINVV